LIAGVILVAVLAAVLAFTVFAVTRGWRRIAEGEVELEPGGSWGRQFFSRRDPKT
jgi:hypothetical protein